MPASSEHDGFGPNGENTELTGRKKMNGHYRTLLLALAAPVTCAAHAPRDGGSLAASRDELRASPLKIYVYTFNFSSPSFATGVCLSPFVSFCADAQMELLKERLMLCLRTVLVLRKCPNYLVNVI